MTSKTDARAQFKPSGDREVVMERTFAATPERVFRAFTDPASIPKWWGPRPVVVDRMEVRVGGTWRFIDTDDDGSEFIFHGTYRAIEPPHRLVSTFVFEGWPETEAVETYTLEDLRGRTRLRLVSRFQDKVSRDRMIEHDMESGARKTLERLAALVEVDA